MKIIQEYTLKHINEGIQKHIEERRKLLKEDKKEEY
jgi:hypothetical protein